MTLSFPEAFADFRAFSACLGQNPLRVQGPGGNTSIKDGSIMWIKASGTELADAVQNDIFVPVDRMAALGVAREETGDGSCDATVLEAGCGLRPSIETTFHAALDWQVVAHTHSISTLVHAVAQEGLAAAREKLAGMPVAFIPYAKPGLPLTREILSRSNPETQIYILENHGLIVCDEATSGVAALMDEVEARLAMTPRNVSKDVPDCSPPDGRVWVEESWIARNPHAAALALAGSYYPDHVVFLGPGLPKADHENNPPALLVDSVGIAVCETATKSQRAMLTCLSDLLLRLPDDWVPRPIGVEAEADLLDWDAEKYRQAMAARQ